MPADPTLDFPFSDLIAGYVRSHDPQRRIVDLRTGDDRTLRIGYSPDLYAEWMRNLGQPGAGVTDLTDALSTGRHVYAYGIYEPAGTGHRFEAHRMLVSGRDTERFPFESRDWWPRQLREIARFYRRAQFGTGPIDMRDYRTVLRLGGDKSDHFVQETDTLSRLVYGMASAFMLSGEQDFLDVAEHGTEYLRDHMRFVDRDHDVVYWYHGIDVRDGVESKLFTSEFGDDYAAIPAYEQIYALVGLTQTYRVTGDPAILADIAGTMRLFRKFLHDPEHGGWFSHLDPIELSPHHETLGPNRSRKNWNSIGDHAPAYLINLFLATGDRAYADMLLEAADLIVRHFPRPDSPFVQERFHADWAPDHTWGWQQNRAVVGHNLKIAWNLTRVAGIEDRVGYRELAEHLGRILPKLSADTRRGGWYDVVERIATPDANRHRFVWHDRKAWWQQEQAILAYLILAGDTGDTEFLRQAREAAGFYNAFFLDHDEGGVYYNVLADGTPYLLGNERLKGSHAMSMYHASELCLLATVYQRLLIHREPLDLYFRPKPDGFAGRRLRVAPDILPEGVRLASVDIDGTAYHDFDPGELSVALPDATQPLDVRVRLTSAVD